MSENLKDLPEFQEAQSDNIQSSLIPGEGAIRLLKILVWLNLIIGIIGQIWVLSEFATKSGYFGRIFSEEISIFLGILVLYNGVQLCVLYLVIVSIAENMIFIRRRVGKK